MTITSPPPGENNGSSLKAIPNSNLKSKSNQKNDAFLVKATLLSGNLKSRPQIYPPTTFELDPIKLGEVRFLRCHLC